jgi:hypothetical protein
VTAKRARKRWRTALAALAALVVASLTSANNTSHLGGAFRFGDTEGRDAAGAQAIDFGGGGFDILRIQIAPADDDQVFEPAGHEQLALVEKTEIARGEPGRRDRVFSSSRRHQGIPR